MSVSNINNILIPNILTGSKFRLFRHALLLLTIGVISASINVGGEYKSNYYLYLERIALFLIFSGTIYINMTILVPHFLLKSRLTIYFGAMLASIFAMLLLITLSQFVFHQVDWHADRSYIGIFFSFMYATITFGLIIISTSTFVLFKNWIVNNERISELETITLDAELQQLKNQINPHFLFNMLNNANIMVKQDPSIASQMLLKLDDLLSYQIDDSAKDEVSLVDDISFLTDYLELEKSRRDRFEYTISVDGDIKCIEVSPLLFIPFVENAVKHSVETRNTSYLNISFKIQDGQLVFFCRNTKPKHPLKQTESGGLGLMNIRRRLELLYKDNYSLRLNETDTTYTINLELKL